MEAADFYRGRGRKATYLGTINAPDCSPEGLKLRELFSTDDAELRPVDALRFYAKLNKVFELAAKPGTGLTVWPAERGWPHSYTKSLETQWTVQFEAGALWIHEYGYVVEVIYLNAFREPGAFPAFKPRTAVTG